MQDLNVNFENSQTANLFDVIHLFSIFFLLFFLYCLKRWILFVFDWTVLYIRHYDWFLDWLPPFGWLASAAVRGTYLADVMFCQGNFHALAPQPHPFPCSLLSARSQNENFIQMNVDWVYFCYHDAKSKDCAFNYQNTEWLLLQCAYLYLKLILSFGINLSNYSPISCWDSYVLPLVFIHFDRPLSYQLKCDWFNLTSL